MTDLGKLGAAYVEIRASLDKLEKDFATVQNKTSAAMKKIGAGLQSAGRTMTASITLPAVGLGAAILKSAGDFEAAMNSVSGITSATGEQFEALKEKAKKLGAETQFSASEAAKAMKFLGMAGFDTDQILGSMDATLQLAAASEMDLGSAADTVSNIMTGYRLNVEDLSHANDVLVKTITSTNTDMGQLGEAFKYAGPVAASAGVSFEETAAILGTMGNAGIQASMAGTSLRGALSRMLSPTKQVREAMAKAGITFKDAEGRLRPLDQIIKDLEPHADDAGLMMELFGLRAGPAMGAVVSQGADNLKRLKGELETVGNVTKKLADIQMKGFNGAMKELKSAAEAVFIAIGESGLLSSMADFAKSVAAWFRDLAQTNPRLLKLGVLIAGVAAAIGPLLLVAGTLITSFGAIAGVLGGVAGTGLIASLAGPAGLIIALVSVVSAIASVVKEGSALGKFTRDTSQMFRSMGDKLSRVWGVIKDSAAKVWESVKGVIESVIKAIDAIWSKHGKTITIVVTALWDNITSIFEAVLRTLGDVLSGGLDVLSGLIKTFVGVVTLDWDLFADGMKDIFTGIWKAVSGIMAGAWDIVSIPLKNFVTAISTAWDSFNAWMTERWGVGWDIVKTIVSSVISIIVEKIKVFVDTVKPIWDGFTGALSSAWDTMWSFIGEKTVEAKEPVKKGVDEINQKMTDATASMEETKDESAALATMVSENLVPKIEKASTGFSEMATKTGDAKDEIEKIRKKFAETIRPADDLEKELSALIGHFDERQILEVYGDMIIRIADEHKKLNGEDSLPATVSYLYAQAKAAKEATDKLADLEKQHEKTRKEFDKFLDNAEKKMGTISQTLPELEIKIGESAYKIPELMADATDEGLGVLGQFLTKAIELFKGWKSGLKGIFSNLFTGLFGEKITGFMGKLFGEKGPLSGVASFLSGIFSKGKLEKLMGGLGSLTGGGIGSLIGTGLGKLTGGIGSLIGKGAGKLAGGLGSLAGGGIGSLIGMGAGKLAGLLFSSLATGGIGALVGVGAEKLIKWISGLFKKDPSKAGGKEAARDFGVTIGGTDLRSFAQNLGLVEDVWKGIRKDLESSPAFFKEILLPAAEAQGTVEQLIGSFSRLQTSWGTFDISSAVREAVETGDYERFNKEFEKIFSTSERLREALPNFAEILGGPIIELSGGAGGFIPATGERGTRTGRVSSETERKLTEALSKLEKDISDANTELDRLVGMKDRLSGLVDSLVETGEASDELRSIWEEMGGSISALNDAAQLPGLRQQQQNIQRLQEYFNKFIPVQLDAIDNFIQTGKITEELSRKILDAGGDLQKFEKYSQVAGARETFAELTEQFKETGVFSGELFKIMQRFGDADTKVALAKLLQGLAMGQTTVTEFAQSSEENAALIQGYLENAAGNIESAFGKAGLGVAEELGKMEKTTEEKIAEIMDKLSQQMMLVNQNLSKSIEDQTAAIEKAQEQQGELVRMFQEGLTKSFNKLADSILGIVDEIKPDPIEIKIDTSQVRKEFERVRGDLTKRGFQIPLNYTPGVNRDREPIGRNNMNINFSINALDGKSVERSVRDVILPQIERTVRNRRTGI